MKSKQDKRIDTRCATCGNALRVQRLAFKEGNNYCNPQCRGVGRRVGMTPGERHNHLVFEREDGRNSRGPCGIFRCDCGNQIRALLTYVRTGHTRACGCTRKANFNGKKHGEHTADNTTPEYIAWKAMKQRCADPNFTGARYYYDRGISVCERWVNDYPAFLADVGRKPSPQHSLDRIDPNKNYEPGNVRWATPKQQSQNRRPWAKRHFREGAQA